MFIICELFNFFKVCSWALSLPGVFAAVFFSLFLFRSSIIVFYVYFL
jgi:hypothetical protein